MFSTMENIDLNLRTQVYKRNASMNRVHYYRNQTNQLQPTKNMLILHDYLCLINCITCIFLVVFIVISITTCTLFSFCMQITDYHNVILLYHMLNSCNYKRTIQKHQ